MYMEKNFAKFLFPQENILNVSHSPVFISTWHKSWTISKKKSNYILDLSPYDVNIYFPLFSHVMDLTDDADAKGWFPIVVFISTATTSVVFVTQLLYSDRTTIVRLVYLRHLLPPASVNHNPNQNEKIKCPHCYQPAININSGCILLVNSNQLFLCSVSKKLVGNAP